MDAFIEFFMARERKSFQASCEKSAPRYSLPVLVVLGDADDLEVEGDDDADGEDEAERVIGDGEDGVVPKDGEAGAELGAERERRQRRAGSAKDQDAGLPVAGSLGKATGVVVRRAPAIDVVLPGIGEDRGWRC